MKVIYFLLVIFGSVAWANDGGVAYIDVKGIDPGPLASEQSFRFYGKDAAKFMRLLPEYSSVEYSIIERTAGRAVAELVQANERGVAIVSNGWTLSISCQGIEKITATGPDGYSEVVDAKEVPAECQFKAYRNDHDPRFKYDLLGDSWPMEEKDYTKMCVAD